MFFHSSYDETTRVFTVECNAQEKSFTIPRTFRKHKRLAKELARFVDMVFHGELSHLTNLLENASKLCVDGHIDLDSKNALIDHLRSFGRTSPL